MKKKQKKPPSKTKKLHVKHKPNHAGLVVLLFVLVMVGVFGWWWKQQVVFKQTHVNGAVFSSPDSILALARIDSNMLYFDIVPQQVEARVQTAPWVESVTVSRLPNAEIAIDVQEREPALLLLNENGHPDRFLDRNGYQMPFHKGALFDVPLLIGFQEKFHPTEPIQHPSIINLLHDLEQVSNDVDALISAFTIKPSGEIYLQTNPVPGRGSIDVRLGYDKYAQKLTKLHAFWHQAVLAKREYNIKSIDLRFDSQIITQEVRLSQ